MEHQTLQENSNESIQQFLNTYRSIIQSGELQFIDNIYKSNTISSIKKYINGWIIKTATQDGILQELVNSERILLVGSGYIPYSLIHLNKHYDEIHKIYIDAGSGSLGVGIFDHLIRHEQTKRKDPKTI